MKIEIDQGSGFCFGVTRAINKAEEELARGATLYCLGDIVHNGKECDRLKKLGLITIDHATFSTLHHAKVLLRAHGEPPATYGQAETNGIEIIDATCPVVLHLQERIKKEYQAGGTESKQIVIYGKNGHAEVPFHPDLMSCGSLFLLSRVLRWLFCSPLTLPPQNGRQSNWRVPSSSLILQSSRYPRGSRKGLLWNNR